MTRIRFVISADPKYRKTVSLPSVSNLNYHSVFYYFTTYMYMKPKFGHRWRYLQTIPTISFLLKSSNFVFRCSLIFCYHFKKNGTESPRTLVEVYGGLDMILAEHSVPIGLKFQLKSSDFYVRNDERGISAKKIASI